MKSVEIPTLELIAACADRIRRYLVRTPVVDYVGTQLLPTGHCRVSVKLELLQRTGSFKPRGALNVMMSLDEPQRAAGVTAFSAGNHAIAVAYAASVLGLDAKVVMPTFADPYRVQQVEDQGAEIEFVEDMSALAGKVEQLVQAGRTMVHPFEGPLTTAGTATVGQELCEDRPSLDAVIVPVGGGGLISGVASAVRQMIPGCKVYGVEPALACGMSQSLALGRPLDTVEVSSIADSLSAPMHLPYSFSVVQQTVEQVVTVSDEELAEVMKLLFTDMKLAVEPAAAAGFAALRGPLKDLLAGQHVGIIACGANIDPASWAGRTGLSSTD